MILVLQIFMITFVIKLKVCKNPIWSDKYYSRADIFQDNGIRKHDPAQEMVKGFTKEMAWNLVLEN